MKLASLTITIAVASAATAGGTAIAQQYPARTIRMVVPYPPGGGTDLLARPVAQKLSQKWSQSVVIDNRSGANGMIGGELVSKSPPDGHTLMMGTSAELALNLAVYSKCRMTPSAISRL